MGKGAPTVKAHYQFTDKGSSGQRFTTRKGSLPAIRQRLTTEKRDNLRMFFSLKVSDEIFNSQNL